MKKILSENQMHKSNHDAIFETLGKDIEKCKKYQEQFISMQEIYDFTKDWETNRYYC